MSNDNERSLKIATIVVTIIAGICIPIMTSTIAISSQTGEDRKHRENLTTMLSELKGEVKEFRDDVSILHSDVQVTKSMVESNTATNKYQRDQLDLIRDDVSALKVRIATDVNRELFTDEDAAAMEKRISDQLHSHTHQ